MRSQANIEPVSATRMRPAPSFFGAPVAGLDELGPDRIAIAGIYCDHYSGGAPGGRFAARQIRYCSSSGDFHPPDGPDTRDLVDIGDLNVFPLDPERTLDVLAEQSAKVLRTGTRLLALGGDYSVSPGLFNGAIMAAPERAIGLIRISRRLDLFATSSNESMATRRTTTARMVDLAAGGTEHVALLAARGPSALEEIRKADEATVVSAATLLRDLDAALYEFRENWTNRYEALYLSVDIDSLDPRFSRSALPRGDAGLTVDQLLSLVGRLRGLPIVCADVTGHVPDLDLSGRPSSSATAEIAYAVAGALREGHNR